MRTYRELLQVPEFTPFLLASSVQVAAQTISSLALGILIYSATGSPLLSALAIFGPSLTQVIGASTVLSASDRLPPRTVLSGLSLVFAVGTAVLAIPGVPVWGAFAIVGCMGLGTSLAGAARYGLLNELVPGAGYMLGRSVLNMSVGAMQISLSVTLILAPGLRPAIRDPDAGNVGHTARQSEDMVKEGEL